MAEYIEREAAIESVCYDCAQTGFCSGSCADTDRVRRIPAADVRPVVRGKWIPVTERLPEHGWYLAYGPTIKMEVLHFHSVEEVWSSERYYDIEVTHWMPLPEPPKEET